MGNTPDAGRINANHNATCCLTCHSLSRPDCCKKALRTGPVVILCIMLISLSRQNPFCQDSERVMRAGYIPDVFNIL
ncbi:hypothetical protein BN439_2928 [Erwinia amylovora Ea644]|nr:hypothetical protein BN439_2928 [Erwinia amylovora Ea644]